jgi:hypothetical protein
MWFVVEARDEAAALGRLTRYLVERTDAVQVAEVTDPVTLRPTGPYSRLVAYWPRLHRPPDRRLA